MSSIHRPYSTSSTLLLVNQEKIPKSTFTSQASTPSYPTLIRQLVIGLIGAFVAIVLTASLAQAADITVNVTGDSANGSNGECTLREAINNVNTSSDTTDGDCAAGDGVNDTINLPAGRNGD